MHDDALPHLWPAIREQLRRAVDEPVWDLWLAPLRALDLDGSTLVVEAPATACAWVSQRYGRLLQACATSVVGAPVAVTVREEGDPGDSAGESGDAPVRPGSQPLPGGNRINPRLTFDQFVIGDSNRLAHAAALSVAELPGLAYNPLFICGRPGLGKTHLLHSIANYAAEHNDGLVIRLTSAESFTNEFLGALHGHGDIEAFKAAHRRVDMLLVDDVQFLQSKLRTEQEFFHLFNDLHAGGAQIVLTSDRPPRDMEALEDRLRERFAAGLVCEVRPPDRVTRETIVRKRVINDCLNLVEPAAVRALAERSHDNVRALEGALIRVVAFGSLTGRPVTGQLAAQVLDELSPDTARSSVPTIAEIQDRVCREFGVQPDQVMSSSRASRLTWPRQVAMYLARELTEESLPSIGAAFGGRSHTTVLHACRRTAERMKDDPEAATGVHKLVEELGRRR